MARKILTPLDITTGGNAITSSAIGVVPLTVKAASGQTADLFQIQNNSASPISQQLVYLPIPKQMVQCQYT
jgi:hypothetical protein